MSWGYGKDDGPSTWVEKFLDGNTTRQSPVDIITTSAKVDSGLAQAPLVIRYSEEDNITLENTGLSFKIHTHANSVLTGGPLGSTKYKLEQFHFHWGHNDHEGSEHRVNGQMFASELHLVHYNADKYPSFAEAAARPDGLAVLGVFIKVGDENAAMKILTDHAMKVKNKGSHASTGSKFNPASLLPANTTDYWAYEGSLTTPPLYESVSWLVLKTPIEISKTQIQTMRHLSSETDGSKPIPPNYRPPQPLQGREIKASFSH